MAADPAPRASLADRALQAMLVLSAIGFWWLAMMAVHEAGHVIHAWLSGATVARLVLHPLSFSRTDLGANPHPLFVAWGGAVWGCLIPLALLALVRLAAKPGAWLARFFAAFCLIANGAYLAGGTLFAPGGGDDAGVLLAHGAAPWQLVAFGLPAVVAGLWLLDGLGPHFGLGPAGGRVDRRAALAAAAALVVLIVVELIFSSVG
jgi:hypothetical protein